MATTYSAFVNSLAAKSLDQRFQSDSLGRLATPGLIRKEYTEAGLYKENVFMNPQLLHLDDLGPRCEQLLEDLSNPNFGPRSVSNLFIVAANLLSPDSSQAALNYVYQNVIDQWAEFMVKDPGVNQNTEAAALLDRQAGARPVRQQPPPVDAAYAQFLPDHIVQQEVIPEQDHDLEMNHDRIQEVCFVAAFLLRMVNKAPDKTHGAWNSGLSKRFEKWFGRPLSVVNPGEAQMRLIKNKLEDLGPIKSSWVVLVAKRDQADDISSPEYGINKYLGVTPLEYGAMQVQNLFMQCWHKTKIPPGVILEKMYSPITKTAVLEILFLCSELEPKEGARSSTTFRYSRMINPQYFAGVQSKECPVATAILVYLLEKVMAFGAGMNPEEMVIMTKMSQSIKTKAKEVANRIYSEQHVGQEEEYSSTMRAVFARPEVDQPRAAQRVDNYMDEVL
ncbi:TPA_asm: N [Pentaphragma betacytorhabdovirus 1]|nr:TPA_asm: N [Pentaphragma betacytorhabdovirus 1]